MMSADLDALEAAAGGFDGALKVQICGPWTLAATLELTRSIEPALSDDFAVTDLTASLCEGIEAHLAAVRRRVPGARLVVQVDEPALPGVLAGSVPTASGLRRVPAVSEQYAADTLGSVLAAAQVPGVVHCCARDAPLRCITRAGAAAVSFDLGLLRRDQEDGVGEAAEAGLGIWAGTVPPLAHGVAKSPENAGRDTAAEVIALWRRIGLPMTGLAGQVVVTPACGLAGASPARARAALAQCRAAARMIPELVAEGAA